MVEEEGIFAAADMSKNACGCYFGNGDVHR